jgi:hypothetical protein
MVRVLHVAEKNSVRHALARILAQLGWDFHQLTWACMFAPDWGCSGVGFLRKRMFPGWRRVCVTNLSVMSGDT